MLNQSSFPDRRRPWAVLDAAVGAITIASLCAVAVIVGFSTPTNHDEFQYIAASYLFPDLRIYEDYFYSQTPYFPVLLSAWLESLRPFFESPYLLARAFNVLWSVTFVIALGWVLLRISPSRMLAAAVLFAVCASSVLDLSMRVVRNDMMPLALSTVALGLLARSYRAPPESSGAASLHFLAGFLVALAIGTKQSYAFVAVAGATASLAMAQISWTIRLRHRLLPFACGVGIGALPIAALAAYHWENFSYSVFEFHRVAHVRWYEIRGSDADFSLPSRVLHLLQVLKDGPLLGLAVIGLLWLALRYAGPGRDSRRGDYQTVSVLVLCSVGLGLGLLTCLLAQPLHPQYVAPVLPYLGGWIVAGARLAHLSPGLYAVVGGVLFAATLAFGLAAENGGTITHVKSMLMRHGPSGEVLEPDIAGVNPDVAGANADVPENDVWVSAHLARVTSKLRQVLGPGTAELKIATLMPIYPIEAGFGIHREFAGAPFFFRANDHLTTDELAELAGTGPSAVEQWLVSRNVHAIMTGYDRRLEGAFLNYARNRGFACFRIELDSAYEVGEGRLLVLPAIARMPSDCSLRR